MHCVLISDLAAPSLITLSLIHTGTVRTLSELQSGDPLILTLARGKLLPQRAPAAP